MDGNALNSPSQHLQSITPVVVKMFKSTDAVVIIHYGPHGAAAVAGRKDLPHLCERTEIDYLLTNSKTPGDSIKPVLCRNDSAR